MKQLSSNIIYFLTLNLLYDHLKSVLPSSICSRQTWCNFRMESITWLIILSYIIWLIIYWSIIWLIILSYINNKVNFFQQTQQKIDLSLEPPSPTKPNCLFPFKPFFFYMVYSANDKANQRYSFWADGAFHLHFEVGY